MLIYCSIRPLHVQSQFFVGDSIDILFVIMSEEEETYVENNIYTHPECVDQNVI